MQNSNGNLRLLEGFLIGGTISAAVTLLIAPQSGLKTRREIQRGVLKAQKRTRLVLEEAKDRAVGAVEDVQSMAQELSQNIIHEAKERVAEVVNISK
jgi:gas vesicle protein